MRIRYHRALARAAFTLTEMLVVVAIIVVLAGIGGAILLPTLDKAKDDTDRAQAHTVAEACKHYQINNDTMPNNTQVLTQPDPNNGNKPYLSQDAILDSRKQPFQIDPSGQMSGTEVDVFTTNKNGEKIGNWKKK